MGKGEKETLKIPDLRHNPRYERNRTVAIIACVLAAAFMYPSILAPLFGYAKQRGKLTD